MNVAQPLTTVNLARGQTMTDSNSTEKWLPITDWEDFYEVSDHGRIRSFDRTVEKCFPGNRRINQRSYRWASLHIQKS